MRNEIMDLLEIRTLGHFTVKYGTEVISEKSVRSKVLWELFKYLLTNRGSRLPADTVLETLWPEKEYADTGAAFKAQIHRLKKMLEENGLDEERHLAIVYTQGCYRLDLGSGCWLDAAVLDDLFDKADTLSTEQPREAMEIYQRLITLYKGDYLPEISSPWVFPDRNNYRRIFLKSVFNLDTLYRQEGMFAESIGLYEDALQIVPFEEELHIRYLQALMSAGKKGEARAHYENITSREYLETGTKPSMEMKDIYQLITHKSEKVDMDLSNIHEMMVDRSKTDSGYVCPPDYFRFLYSLEKRRLERRGRTAFLGLLTVTRRNYKPLSLNMQEAAVAKLTEIVGKNIRKGDVYTQWNETQFLLLLPDLTRELGERVLKRIRNQFRKETAPEDLILRYKIKSLI